MTVLNKIYMMSINKTLKKKNNPIRIDLKKARVL